MASSCQSNEITAIPLVLPLLVLEGVVVTIEALSCQPAIAAPIRVQRADQGLALKDNPPKPHAPVADVYLLTLLGGLPLVH